MRAERLKNIWLSFAKAFSIFPILSFFPLSHFNAPAIKSKRWKKFSSPFPFIYVGDENLPLLYMGKKKEKGLNGMHNSNVEEEKTTRTHLLIFSGYEVCFSPGLKCSRNRMFFHLRKKKSDYTCSLNPPLSFSVGETW